MAKRKKDGELVGGELVGRTEMIPIGSVKPNPWNPNRMTEHVRASLKFGLQTEGWIVSQAVLVWGTDDRGRAQGMIIDGEHRWTVAKELGFTEAPAVVLHGVTEAKAKSLTAALNARRGEPDRDRLVELLRSIETEVPRLDMVVALPQEDVTSLLAGLDASLEPPESRGGAMFERFGVPPFSVFDARKGYWQARKRAWLALGIKSELGRVTSLLKVNPKLQETGAPKSKMRVALTVGGLTSSKFPKKTRKVEQQTGEVTSSVFDPVLTEILYRWFTPPGGKVLDPFAGGSVRGVIAAALGREYVGVELRGEQVEANRKQWDELAPRLKSAGFERTKPKWIEGDSVRLEKLVPKGEVDFVFSCPPYADLEVYSDDPRDLSAMSHADFVRFHAEIIKAACARLRNDRFAAWVIGNVRRKDGSVLDLAAETVAAFEAAGLRYYNDGILVTSVASLSLRASRSFGPFRKLGRTHQYVLTFVKGDWRKASEALGEMDGALELDEATAAWNTDGDE